MSVYEVETFDEAMSHAIFALRFNYGKQFKIVTAYTSNEVQIMNKKGRIVFKAIYGNW